MGLAESDLFARFHSVADRVVVVDTETTGVYTKDRVLEVALITYGFDGSIIDEWDTLIDPCRDVGPTHIHGITPQMLEGAPSFDEVAGEIAVRLHGAILCAHNFPFDSRMLAQEFERDETDVAFGVGFDTLSVTRCKLALACEELGIRFDGAHQALNDARATGQLLFALGDRFETAEPARISGRAAVAGSYRRLSRSPERSVTAASSTYLAGLIAKMDHSSNPADLTAYLDLLDRAMADLHLDSDERSALDQLAKEIGLSARQVEQANASWLRSLTELAQSDGIVDDREYEDLLRAAHVLGQDPARIHQSTQAQRTTQRGIELTSGLTVCFTGTVTDSSGFEIPREVLEDHAGALSLEVERSVTKSRCSLVIAADPASNSGKATNARKWGIPICTATDFLAATAGGHVEASVEATAPTTATCATCGIVFTNGGTRESKRSVCAECSAAKPSSRRSSTGNNGRQAQGPLSGRRLWCSPNCALDTRDLIEQAGGKVGKSVSKTVYAVVVADGDEGAAEVTRAEALALVIVTEDEARLQIEDQFAKISLDGDTQGELSKRIDIETPTPEALEETTPAGWYANPEAAESWRWWDGQRWTEHTHPR